MSKIWSFMIIISIIVAFFTGYTENVITNIMESGQNAIENIISLIAMTCFWSGIFNIFENTKAIEKFGKFFKKFIYKIFNKKELSEKAIEYMSMNISTNVIGVGNASTVNGIKAMEELQKENPIKSLPNDNITTFVLINTASLQLIPTSMIAMRALYGSENPSAIIVPVWIVTIIALIVGLISIKILNKKI